MLFGKTNKEIIILPTTPQTPINNRFSRDESQSALSREKFKNRYLFVFKIHEIFQFHFLNMEICYFI